MGKYERPQTGEPSGEAGAATVNVLYFASVREGIGTGQESIVLPADVTTVGDFLVWMRRRGPAFEAALAPELGIRTAVDRSHAGEDTPIAGAEEIAIFPMMTGG